MKKIYLFFTLFSLSFGSMAQTPILTMISDGDCTGGNPKVVEIYASGTVDFSQYDVQIQVNAGTSWSNTTNLAALGTITDQFVYLRTTGSAAAFATEYPSVPASNVIDVANAVNFNGNDRIQLVATGTSTVIDQYGVSDQDGAGTAWEYTDGYAKRVSATGPDGGFTPGNWTYFNGALNGEGTCQGGTTTFEAIIGIASYTTGAAGCNITGAGLASLTCNDATTPTDPVDDYLTFDLNPMGSTLGTDYTVSVSAGTITPTTATYGSATSFQLQAGSAGAGNVTVTITDDTDSGCTFDVVITDPGACSSAVPDITVAPTSLTGFDHIVGTPSTEQSFTVSGLTLTDDITLTAPTNYEISETSGSGFTNSIVLTQTGGVVANTTIYVRANAAAMGTINEVVVASSTGADNDTVFVEGYADDYVYYTIDQIDGVDAVDGTADSLDVLVELTGVVYCMDFDGNAGYSITLIDGSNEGINLYSGFDVSNYTNPMAGDSLRVFGKLIQFNGLLEIQPDSIDVLAQGVAMMNPTVVTVLDETTESQYITLENLTFVTPTATWASGNVEVTDGVNNFFIRIDSDTDLPGAPAPQVSFSATGIGSQYDSSNPYTDDYQLFPCGTSSIVPSCTMPVNTVTVAGTTATADASGLTYQWIDCSDDSEVNGATNASFTPSVSGDYAVIITDGECSDTSACVSIQLSGVGVNELALENAISIYPNPVQDALTIQNNTSSAITVEVVDLNGKTILEPQTMGTTTTIQTSGWNKGVYFVRLSGAQGETLTKRIIK